jgi:hypothetical protein
MIPRLCLPENPNYLLGGIFLGNDYSVLRGSQSEQAVRIGYVHRCDDSVVDGTVWRAKQGTFYEITPREGLVNQ